MTHVTIDAEWLSDLEKELEGVGVLLNQALVTKRIGNIKTDLRHIRYLINGAGQAIRFQLNPDPKAHVNSLELR